MIPSSLTVIDNNAFSKCSSLTQITFESPSSLTEIGSYALNECSSLTQIAVSPSVAEIGADDFKKMFIVNTICDSIVCK